MDTELDTLQDESRVHLQGSEDVEDPATEKKKSTSDLLYSIDENPPWYLSLALGFQQYLTMFGGTFTMPFVLSVPLCFADKPVIISQVLSTVFFVSGLTTLLQSTFGVRLPIVQGGTYTLVASIYAIMSVKGKCPASGSAISNASSVTAAASTGGEEEWLLRMREIQGAIIVSALFQVVVGFSGLMGLMIKFIGPLTIVPTISLVGLPLFKTAAGYASVQWGISMTMIFFIVLFSQVIKEYSVPIPFYSSRRWTVVRVPLFKLFSISLSIMVVWTLSAILTAADVLPQGSKARTDTRLSVLNDVSWLRVPYPGQWGLPSVRFSAVIGLLAGTIASMIESIGDYFACAKLAGAPPPPLHAINRGLGIEGIGCILTGIFGTANGTTSYSSNIAAIGITRVGSRRVIQFGALIMIVLATIGKFGAVFATIPDPIIGGIFIVMFGLITAVGLSALRYCDLTSMRNLFVLGFSLFFGMVVPFWVKDNSDGINTGSAELDQIIVVLLSTNMAVGGVTGCILDNLIPGTPQERGILTWRSSFTEKGQGRKKVASIHTYDVPFISKYLNKSKFAKYVPFLPYYGDNGGEKPT